MGPLAEASGLTVRTLHHWDTIGLLSPSQRTAGGHREYTEDEVVRLYQVLALRSLGLGLGTIAICLDTGVDPARVVRGHLSSVDASIAALTVLRERVARLGDELADGRAPTSTALLDALWAIGGTGREGEEALRRHLDADQIQELQTRADALGPVTHYLLEVEWPELYRRAERLRVAGTPPTDQKVRRLVASLDELSALFTGGDAAVSAGVRDAWHDDPAAMSRDPDAAGEDWRELASYLDRARNSSGHPNTA